MTAPTRYNGAVFGTGTFASSATGSIDIGSNADTVVLATGGENASGATTVVGCTLNGVAMTQIATANRPATGGTVTVWAITSDEAIGSGSVTGTMTMSDGNSKPDVIFEVWHGCAGSPRYVVGTPGLTSSGTSHTAAVTTTVDDVAIAMCNNEFGITMTATGGGGSTIGANTGAATTATDFAVYEAGQASSTTLAWTSNSSVQTQYTPVALKGSAAASGGGPLTGGLTRSILTKGRLVA